MILLDMDGLICNFMAESARVHGGNICLASARYDSFAIDLGFSGIDDKRFWDPLGYDFWANLPWIEDGRILVDLLERRFGVENIAICSKPCMTRGSADGKIAWLAKNLPGYENRYILTTVCKSLSGGPDRGLVDDYDGNIDAFGGAGYPCYLVPRPWNRRRDDCLDGWKFDPHRVFEELLELGAPWERRT